MHLILLRREKKERQGRWLGGGGVRKNYFLVKSKKSVLDRFYIHFNRPTKIFLNFEFTLVFV